jgi:hypothetical protein
MFLLLNYHHKPNMDDEYKFRNDMQFTQNKHIWSLFIEEGLAEQTKDINNNNSTKTTLKHKEVVRAGGWKAYLKDIKEDKERRIKLERLSINNHKFQWFFAVITIAIIGANCYFDYQTLKLNKVSIEKKDTSSEIKKLEKQLQTQNQQLQRIEASYIQYQNQLDSLLSPLKKALLKKPFD